MCVSTYCSLTIELKTKRPLIMDYGADAHIVHSPLQLYEGDCDNDSECASGLKCFDRDNDSECASGLKCFHSDEFSQIPSCNGNGIQTHDYCVRSDDDRRLISDNIGAGIGLCGELSPLLDSMCPRNQVINYMPNCKNVEYGNLCESDGECVSDTIDNCGSVDVFVKAKPLDPYSLVKCYINDKCMILSKDNNVTFNSCTGESRQR